MIDNDDAETYDPTLRCCAWCYGPAISKCPNCPRLFCSRECQVSDWKKAGGYHKYWCGKSGEMCVDYEIAEAGNGKGLGMFAKRDISRGEKILVERPIKTSDGSWDRDPNSSNKMTTNIERAMDSLTPMDGSVGAKFEANCVALGNDDEDSGSGIFVHFSRVNHDCIGNSSHFFEQDIGLMLLVANREIAAGEEITFSYVCNTTKTQRDMRLAVRGFACTCVACQSPEIASKIDRMVELDKNIMTLCYNRRIEAAILAGKSLIRLYDEFHQSDSSYARTYYDLFQVAISKRKTVKQGLVFIKKAYDHELIFSSRENEAVRKYKQYMLDPSHHRNYRKID